MPSRNSYSFVPRSGARASQPLDIENEDGREAILIAVQLCRIVLRALEVEAFKSLQKSVNDLAKSSKSGKDVELLADQLLKILLSLRWRIAWWVVTGDGSNGRDDSADRFTERVTRLTQVLYCYYFIAKKRLPSSRSEFSNGRWSDYADAGPVWEDLPDVDSIDGFRAWMLRGQELIRSANIPQRLSSYSAFVSPSICA
ncbi:hypothetical protein MMC28_006757 [Mycoblastus sanguinarius]|nr:hypothetical protein [Mycoblastus sanguinarius]